jgi:hypothetical protein
VYYLGRQDSLNVRYGRKRTFVNVRKRPKADVQAFHVQLPPGAYFRERIDLDECCGQASSRIRIGYKGEICY